MTTRKAEASPFKRIAVAAARAAHDKKAEDVVLWNVRAVSGVADFLLVASVTSPAHLEAVHAAIEDMMESAGVELRHRDGSHSALWRVLDFGGLLVHLMLSETRAFYALDKLYHDAPKQRWL
ncbi:MAG: ribosome silencing factor [Elusimicrobia bacterium]|nr:ribosome silencing factor [Elusimicrobiota bacterium]